MRLLSRSLLLWLFFFSSRRRHTRCLSDWSSDVCSSDLGVTRDPEGVVVDAGPVLGMNDGTGPAAAFAGLKPDQRSEERRVGKEWRSRGCADQSTQEMST